MCMCVFGCYVCVCLCACVCIRTYVHYIPIGVSLCLEPVQLLDNLRVVLNKKALLQMLHSMGKIT